MDSHKIIELKGVEKWYGKDKATGPLDLSVYKGELVSFLGPSGCGKTTALRCISGLIKPTSGTIMMNGKIINDVPTHKRGIGMVFQNYALFPHLSIFENVAFGLKVRKFNKKDIQKITYETLDLVMLKEVADRYPHELSGGQQQRISLARSLVCNPTVLLLDEPLSNLDLKLREQMRLEIIRIHEKFKTTSIYVTHDQGEALSMSNRIFIMNKAMIEQVGTPREIYMHPKSKFVANFIGRSNFLEGRIHIKGNNKAYFVTEKGLELRITLENKSNDLEKTLLIRPESIDIDFSLTGDNVFKGKIENIVYQGDTTEYHVIVEKKEKLIINRKSEGEIINLKPGIQVKCKINPDFCSLLES